MVLVAHETRIAQALVSTRPKGSTSEVGVSGFQEEAWSQGVPHIIVDVEAARRAQGQYKNNGVCEGLTKYPTPEILVGDDHGLAGNADADFCLPGGQHHRAVLPYGPHRRADHAAGIYFSCDIGKDLPEVRRTAVQLCVWLSV